MQSNNEDIADQTQTALCNSAPLLPSEGPRANTFQLWNCAHRQENPRGGWQLQNPIDSSSRSRLPDPDLRGLHGNRPLVSWSKMSQEAV